LNECHGAVLGSDRWVAAKLKGSIKAGIIMWIPVRGIIFCVNSEKPVTSLLPGFIQEGDRGINNRLTVLAGEIFLPMLV
jgi:hypothetical protein